MSTLLDKIGDLKKQFALADDSDQSIIASWEKEAKEKMIIANLEGNEAVMFIKNKIDEDIAKINDVLQNASSKELSTSERDVLLKIKTFYGWFKSLFVIAKSSVAQIENEIDANLEQ